MRARPLHAFRLEDYAAAFRRADDLGLGRTVHAGEGAAARRDPRRRRGTPRSASATEPRSSTTRRWVYLVIERGVTIEASPTSDVRTGDIARIGVRLRRQHALV
jgi:adenosine deaminase